VPTIYAARERETIRIPISEVLRDGQFDIYPEVQGRGYFDIRLKGDELSLTPGRFVGLIPVNSRMMVQVQPKLPVGNLVEILVRSGGVVGAIGVLEAGYGLSEASGGPLLDIMAEAFVASLERLEIEGMPKAYEEEREEGSFVKGRVLFGESIRGPWSRGNRHRATSAYYDLRADLPINRLLRFACYALLRHFLLLSRQTPLIQRLAHFEALLADSGVELAQPDEASVSLAPLGAASRVQVRATRLAQAIISDRCVELPVGGTDVFLPSLVLDMEALFERYVRAVLTEKVTEYLVLDGNKEGSKPLFDDQREPPAQPDIVFLSRGVCRALGEVKYKVSEKREDINQVLAYALSFRAPLVLVIVPAESTSTPRLTKVGTLGDVNIFRCRFDLAAVSLDAEESALAQAVSTLFSS